MDAIRFLRSDSSRIVTHNFTAHNFAAQACNLRRTFSVSKSLQFMHKSLESNKINTRHETKIKHFKIEVSGVVRPNEQLLEINWNNSIVRQNTLIMSVSRTFLIRFFSRLKFRGDGDSNSWQKFIFALLWGSYPTNKFLDGCLTLGSCFETQTYHDKRRIILINK